MTEDYHFKLPSEAQCICPYMGLHLCLLSSKVFYPLGQSDSEIRAPICMLYMMKWSMFFFFTTGATN